MCMFDGNDDYSTIWDEQHRTARVAHCCEECGRRIERGERYLYVSSLFEGKWDHFRFCAHCQVCQAWLRRECGGFLVYGVAEDLGQHWDDNPICRTTELLLLVTGIGWKWRYREGELMPVPYLDKNAERLISYHMDGGFGELDESVT